MINTILSILFIYIFVVGGFFLKRIKKDSINDKTLNFTSIFFLQPFLTFWGLTLRPLDFNLVLAPLVFLLIFIISLIFTFLIARTFKDKKEKSIVTITGLIGNTGNLGVPLGLAIFGPESVPYLTMINLMNIFICFIPAVYFYSRANFSIIESVKNIFKLPILWFAVLALTIKYFNIPLHEKFRDILEIGAHASIAVQLILFGVYLAQIKIKEISVKLNITVSIIKFIIYPLIGFFIIKYFNLPSFIASILFLEIIVPIAVNNINLASLYDCKSNIVTETTFVTSILSIVLIPLWFVLFEMFI